MDYKVNCATRPSLFSAFSSSPLLLFRTTSFHEDWQRGEVELWKCFAIFSQARSHQYAVLLLLCLSTNRDMCQGISFILKNLGPNEGFTELSMTSMITAAESGSTSPQKLTLQKPLFKKNKWCFQIQRLLMLWLYIMETLCSPHYGKQT